MVNISTKVTTFTCIKNDASFPITKMFRIRITLPSSNHVGVFLAYSSPSKHIITYINIWL